METPWQYRSIDPVRNDAYFKAGSGNIDFEVSCLGEEVMPGSFCLSGDLRIFSNESSTTAMVKGDDITMDHLAGVASTLRGVKVSINSTEVVDSLDYYNRFCRMNTEATQRIDSLGAESLNALELRAPNPDVLRGLLPGKSALEPWQSFVHQLQISLNQATATDKTGKVVPATLLGDKLGLIRITLELETNENCLYGPACPNTAGYRLYNLRLLYKARPVLTDITAYPITTIHTRTAISKSIETSTVSIQASVKNLADGVSVSFLPKSELNTFLYNGIATRVLPALKKVVFSRNDSESSQTSFPLEHQEEILWNYLTSFRQDPDADCILTEGLETVGIYDGSYAAGEGFGLGLGWGSLVNLSAQKFEIQIQTGQQGSWQISSDLAYQVFMFFSGYRQLV